MSTLVRDQIEAGAPQFLTPAQLAELLQVNERTVLRWAASDASMPTTRIGRIVRFEKAPLMRWLARKRPRLAQTMSQGASSAA